MSRQKARPGRFGPLADSPFASTRALLSAASTKTVLAILAPRWFLAIKSCATCRTLNLIPTDSIDLSRGDRCGRTWGRSYRVRPGPLRGRSLTSDHRRGACHLALCSPIPLSSRNSTQSPLLQARSGHCKEPPHRILAGSVQRIDAHYFCPSVLVNLQLTPSQRPTWCAFFFGGR